MTKTTNEQWEYLFEIIQKSETKLRKECNLLEMSVG